MLKPVAAVAAIFLLIVAMMASELPVDNSPAPEAADSAEPDIKPEPKPFTSPAVDTDIEGTGADSEQDDEAGFADEYDINPFSAAPIDSFGNDSVDVDPTPSIQENSVDHDIESDQAIAESSALPSKGAARPRIVRESPPPLKSEINH
ncbi:hypothetical protein [Alterisphingorhabdus coralli]|uniref:Secreted protein n=1 Tax=Alterisphingorhabdus coralli TaxID=3071408 RepID=A0AA97FBC4_9SPHN|nr:hypothetical protein [Parasphingorhabdus sp. SCSIO 66989]WOE76512.1 hypothetical protein RB602_07300 [Parasphingorhabdus sp. SCSIO 66989]